MENTDIAFDDLFQTATGWVQVDADWYYIRNGKPVTGWLQLGKTWYYCSADGAMQTGWLKLGNTWYYLNRSGAMVSNRTLTINGVPYRFNASGVWVG